MTPAPGSEPHPIYLAGRWVESPDRLVVTNPARPTRRPAPRTSRLPGNTTRRWPPPSPPSRRPAGCRPSNGARHAPYQLRHRGATRGDRALIAAESAKPIRDSLAEVDRAGLTFRIGAEEAERIGGEVIPLDLNPASRGRTGSSAASRSARSRRSAPSTSRSTWPRTSSRRPSPRATRSSSSRLRRIR